MPRERFTQAASVLNISQPAISCQALCSFFFLFFSFFYYFLAVPEEADALERTSISCFKRSISSNTAATSAFFAVIDAFPSHTKASYTNSPSLAKHLRL